MAESHECAQYRWMEVTAAVDIVRPRLNPEQLVAIDAMLKRLQVQRPPQPITEINLGCFNADLVDEDDQPLLSDDEDDQNVYVRPVTVFSSTSVAQTEREKRKNRIKMFLVGIGQDYSQARGDTEDDPVPDSIVDMNDPDPNSIVGMTTTRKRRKTTPPKKRKRRKTQ